MTVATAPQRVLDALTDPTRQRVLHHLADQGEASATRIATQLPVSRQAVVQHLGVLTDAGLVHHERRGREVLYRVDPAPLDATARWLHDLADAWDRRLLAIKAIAESDQ